MNYYISVFKKYAVFNGRARRAEFWYFLLFNFIVAIILAFIDSALVTIYQFAILIPGVSVSVRRMHDINKSGWFSIIPIYSWILMFRNGTKGTNKYGNDPKMINDSRGDDAT